MTVMTIKFVNHPKDATSKFGSIVDTGGTRYPCPAPIVGQFRQGETYDVPTKQETWKTGPVILVAGPPAPASGAAAPTPAASPPPSQQPPHAAGNGMARQSNLDGKDFTIFVTGVVGRAMGSGSFGVTDIDLLTKAAIAAYRDNVA